MTESWPNIDDCRGNLMGKGGLLYYSLDFCVSLKMSKIKIFVVVVERSLRSTWGEMYKNNYFAADCWACYKWGSLLVNKHLLHWASSVSQALANCQRYNDKWGTQGLLSCSIQSTLWTWGQLLNKRTNTERMCNREHSLGLDFRKVRGMKSDQKQPPCRGNSWHNGSAVWKSVAHPRDQRKPVF